MQLDIESRLVGGTACAGRHDVDGRGWAVDTDSESKIALRLDEADCASRESNPEEERHKTNNPLQANGRKKVVSHFYLL
jgi:hypothetical protein